LYIPDYRNNKLIVYDLKEKKIINTCKVLSPHGISIDKDGSIFISCYRENKILKINSNNITKEYSNSLFCFPISITFFKEKLLICNWSKDSNNKILISDKNFNQIKNFPLNYLDFNPHSILYFQREIYIVNHNHHDSGILIFDINGLLKKKIFLKECKKPISIKKIKNYFYICSYFDSSINIYDLNFNLIKKISNNLYHPMNCIFDKQNIFICEEMSNKISYSNFFD
jgi:hypothetical protein